jgi:hemerythrin-like domain-containing protein
MNQPPDLTHFYAIHRQMRIDTRRLAAAIETATPADRVGRLVPLVRWAEGFAHELDEHHFVEDQYFFPELRERIPVAGEILDALDVDHRTVDEILGRWNDDVRALTDVRTPFADARENALDLVVGLRDLLQRHLDIEDDDILPLYTRHYSAAEFDVVYQQAVKNGKKRGLAFVVPWNVLCLEPGPRRDLLEVAPLPLKAVWWATRRRYQRLEAGAFADIRIDVADLRPIPDRSISHRPT